MAVADSFFCHTTGTFNALYKSVALRGLSLRDGLAVNRRQNLRSSNKGVTRHAKSVFSKFTIDESKNEYVQLVIKNCTY